MLQHAADHIIVQIALRPSRIGRERPPQEPGRVQLESFGWLPGVSSRLSWISGVWGDMKSALTGCGPSYASIKGCMLASYGH